MSDAESPYLLGIGDFSRFALLSVRTLRHYDERGLLVPERVDPGNGYRFYAPAQLRTAARIYHADDVRGLRADVPGLTVVPFLLFVLIGLRLLGALRQDDVLHQLFFWIDERNPTFRAGLTLEPQAF